MTSTKNNSHYVLILVGIIAVVMLPVLVLNLLLAENTTSAEKAALASAWQQATHGVTYAPPLSNTRPFKTLRLKDRLPEINTVVLGSSTMMGIREAMLPAPMKAYNFAQTGHGLMGVIAEAEWLLQNSANVKWLVIPLDWSLGFIYTPGVPAATNLLAETTASSGEKPAVSARLLDALSYPRVANLFGILKGVLRAENKAGAFRQYFLQPAGDDYLCPDGANEVPAKDFDTIFRGTCTGFRFDGSATFANLEKLDSKKADVLVARAVVPSAKYAAALIQSRGIPNQATLTRLATLAHGFSNKDGGIVFLLPPLLPGMERALAAAPATAAYLAHTKLVLQQWSQHENLTLIDAGKSEDFGCVATEFVDEHHALPECYTKVFARFQPIIKSLQ